MIGDLSRLPWIEITPEIARLAIATQGELAHVGHHRVAPADVVIATCAHQTGAGVLHYDHDYDVLSTHSGLGFESQWLAPPGTL